MQRDTALAAACRAILADYAAAVAARRMDRAATLMRAGEALAAAYPQLQGIVDAASPNGS